MVRIVEKKHIKLFYESDIVPMEKIGALRHVYRPYSIVFIHLGIHTF